MIITMEKTTMVTDMTKMTIMLITIMKLRMRIKIKSSSPLLEPYCDNDVGDDDNDVHDKIIKRPPSVPLSI